MTDPGAVPEFPDVIAFSEVFNRHGVRYVVIGGTAAQFSVPNLITYDVDFTPATDRDNLDRLSADEKRHVSRGRVPSAGHA